jgi:peptide/nickel transport system permease protein
MATTQQQIQAQVGLPTLAESKGHAVTKEVRRIGHYLRSSPLACIGVGLVTLTFVITIFAPWLAPHDPYAVDLKLKLTAPNGTFWLGTDEAGRDLLSRIVYGARLSVTTGLFVIVLSLLVGSTLGAIAGYVGGSVDEIIMRVADFFMAFPYLILAMAVAYSLGANIQNAMIAIAVVFWPSYARLVRGMVISIRHREFVDAARLMGATRWRIILRHILPQTWGALVIKTSLDIGFAIVAMASLGFIGLGAQPPSAEWGTLIAQSRVYALNAWWYGVFPGLAVFLAVLGFNLLGDTIQELIEPRLRAR